MNPSPFVRTSFWTYWIGLSFAWSAKLGVSQCCVQRFLAVPSIDIAKKSVYAFVIGFTLIKLSSVIVGLTIYARYADCDPIASHKIEKIDQILPLFVMEVASKIPGLPGIFMAGVFSASLSSMSSSLNTIAGSIYEDFIRNQFPKLSEKRASDIMKILVVISGAIIVGLVFIVEKMGQVFRVGFVINGLTVGALSGIFIAGMFSRSINTKGVISGAIGTILVVSVIIIGSVALPKPPSLPISTSGCEFPLNSTLSSTVESFSFDTTENVPIIFKLSFMYYVLLGTIVLFLIALPVSYLTGGCEPFDERLLTPLCRSRNWHEKSQNGNGKKIEKANDSAIYELKAATNDK
jgi:Na+/proline symporter